MNLQKQINRAYKEGVRAQRAASQAHRHGTHGINMMDWGRLVAWVCLIGAAAFWMPVEWQLASPSTLPEMAIAISFGAFMTVGPSVLISTFIPSSRAGRLLLRLNLATPGKAVAIGAGGFLVYYSYQLLFSWWSARPVAADAGIVFYQAVVGIIATIITPALMIAPVSREELSEEMATAHKIDLYEMQARHRIEAIQHAHLRSLFLLKKGLAELSQAERNELTGYMTGLVESIDDSIAHFAGQVAEASHVTMEYSPLVDNTRTRHLLTGLHATLMGDGQPINLDPRQYLTEDSPYEDQPSEPTGLARSDASESVEARYEDNENNDTQRHAATRHDAPRRAPLFDNVDWYYDARRAMEGQRVWSINALTAKLPIEETTVRGLVNEWKELGWVKALQRGHYGFTESER